MAVHDLAQVIAVRVAATDATRAENATHLASSRPAAEEDSATR
jgi:hypothetical protein